MIKLGEMTLYNKTLPFVGSAGKQRGVWNYGSLATFNQEPNSPTSGPTYVSFDANRFHTSSMRGECLGFMNVGQRQLLKDQSVRRC
ncbi:MAG: hypothetical protein JOY62_15050 [Acidobacteriaceae bacterium]|nr:hypothetical protein [Acidobacteriaceae bacterium]MBV9781280.1 hypothetical protein [Acidobacteriaceae bacterium]